MNQAYLPKEFQHNRCNDLTRLGGKSDGGYLASKNDIKKSNALIALGINTDWKFEKDFYDLKQIPIIAFDASTNLKLFVKQFVLAIFSLDLYKATLLPFNYISLKQFFSGKKVLVEKFVGINYGNRYVSLKKIFNTINYDYIFVKMDIEGSEYRCLDHLLENQHKISGAVIEFHDVDLHIQKIKTFIAAFNLRIAHIHVNNYEPIDEDGTPLAIEITFTRFGMFGSNVAILPHELDSANNPRSDEIRINFF